MCADDLDVGLHHLQEARNAHQRPRGPDGADEVVDLAAGLLPDLQRRGLVVRQIVARIGELVGHEIGVGILGHLFPRQPDRSVGTLGSGRQDHLGAVGTDDLPPLDRHRLAHHDLHGIALDDPHDGQSDACIARRGFDDGLAGGQPPVLLGRLDHLERDAVLDAARGVESLELRINVDVRIRAQPVNPHHRGISDGFQNIFFHRNSNLSESRKDNHFPEISPHSRSRQTFFATRHKRKRPHISVRTPSYLPERLFRLLRGLGKRRFHLLLPPLALFRRGSFALLDHCVDVTLEFLLTRGACRLFVLFHGFEEFYALRSVPCKLRAAVISGLSCGTPHPAFYKTSPPRR